MIDFELSEKGDLIFDEVDNLQRFKLAFRIGEHNGIRINFNCNPVQDRTKEDKFHIQFKTVNINNEIEYKATTVSDIEEIAQIIEIRLKTSEEESGRDSVNSTLQKLKHTMNTDTTLCTDIQTLVMSKISDLLDNPTVTVVYQKGSGNFYCQNIKVSINNSDNDLVYEYNI